MRICLIGSPSLSEVGGNVTTIRRLAEGLRARGHEVRYGSSFVDDDLAHLRQWPAHVVHAFHALAAGPAGSQLSYALQAPLVVTLTGTDVHDGVSRLASALVRQVLEQTSAVVAFNQEMLDRAFEHAGSRRPLMWIIPQAVTLPHTTDNARNTLGLEPHHTVFLLVAGLRPVKRPHFPLRPLLQLREEFPHVAYRVLGQAIHAEYAQKFFQQLEAANRHAPGWAAHLTPLAYERMPGMYRAADVVLNCSVSEGMSGAVLEAMSLGRPLLVADIPGNRALVRHEENGLCFRDEAAFVQGARRLLQDDGLRQRLAEAARESYFHGFSATRELDAYEALYERVLQR